MDNKILLSVVNVLNDITEMSDKECEEFEQEFNYAETVQGYPYKPEGIDSRTVSVAFWRSSVIYPIDGKSPIVYCTRNAKIGTLNRIKDREDWDWKVEKYGIVYWCYMHQIVPDCAYDNV